MTPQHYLTAAALIGPAETTTGTHMLALGYCHVITFDPGKPATFGHLDPEARICTLGPVGYPERYDAWEINPTTTRDALITLMETGKKLKDLERQRDYARELLKRGVEEFGWMDGPEDWPEFKEKIVAVLKDNAEVSNPQNPIDKP